MTRTTESYNPATPGPNGRKHATERLIEEAEPKGANAIIAFWFDTSELG